MFINYMCINCGESFMTEKELWNHIDKHKEDTVSAVRLEGDMTHKDPRMTEVFYRAQASDYSRKPAPLSTADIVAMFFVGVLVTLLCAFVVEAQEVPKHRRVPVTFFCVAGTNPGTLSQDDCLGLIRRARAHYRSTANIDILIRKVEQIGEPAPWLITSPSNALEYLRHVQSVFGGSYPRRLKYIVGQPWIDASGNSWILGYSSVCSVAFGRIAYAVTYSLASYYSQRGEDRYWQSLNALVHELGHALGAIHSETGLMHPNALAYVAGDVLPWHYYDLDRITWCLNKRR